MKQISRYDMYEAARNGNLEIIEWIYHQNNLYDPKISEILSLNGRLEMYKWMYERGLIKTDKQHLYNAVKNGHLEMVKWFINNTTLDYDQEAYYITLTNGHLEIAKMAYYINPSLHEYHGVFMSGVISSGQLEILKWMCEIRRFPDYMIYRSLDEALQSKHKDIFEWLSSEFENNIDEDLHTLINMQHVYLLVYLYENNPKIFTPDKIEDFIKMVKHSKFIYRDDEKMITKLKTLNII